MQHGGNKKKTLGEPGGRGGKQAAQYKKRCMEKRINKENFLDQNTSIGGSTGEPIRFWKRSL